MKKLLALILSIVLIISCLLSSVACSTHEHTWGEWQTETQATCTENGKKVRYCTGDASHKEEEVVQAIDHAYGEWTVVTPATCTENGLEKRVCANDSTHVEERPIQATDHDWDGWGVLTPATCTEDGVEQKVCKNDSSHTETRPLSATDHDWGDWAILTPATCTTEGEEQRVCKNDSKHKQTRPTEKAKCVWGDWTVVTPATCTTEGVEKRVCVNESSHYEERKISATGHAYGAWQQVSAPTATTDGLKKRVCTNDPSHVEERALRTLDGKKIIFIGNSYTYYGNLVYPRTTSSYPTLQGRTNDKENFYKLCQSKGATVSVTNWTMDGHGLQDSLGSSCGATNKSCYGDNHYANLTDKNYDYVVFQSGSRNADWSPEKLVQELEKFMVDFKTANPKVKFIFLVHSQAHIESYTWMPARKTLEEKGVIVVDWGDIVYDIMNGTTKVPNSTMTYNKNSFIVAKSASDGYHPNILSGYITSLMTYCAITGDVAYGSEYSFVHNESSTKYQRNIDLYYKQFYKVGTSNFREIIRSDTEMKGIQMVIDKYLDSKPYMNFN